ncbi:MAG: 16S rRNA (guanine(527)-N(7))-methyltransferase RsmG [Cryomorphaceae bacterium]|nr:MAG: 16S rRNA (guanine(527)-N(7))-methyltransferase RsmG [Cryomorphaceae bacterium]
MSDPDLIFRYFPDLTDQQRNRFEQLGPLYAHWNQQINVISRKDMEHFYERHVLHALAIARVIRFKPGTRILDIGTGGGFPGIPLAILFPECHFHLVDSIGKKIKVVKEVSAALGLTNVQATHGRAEEASGSFHFVVNRAVASMQKLRHWSDGKFASDTFNSLPNGMLSLKGGDLRDEVRDAGVEADFYPIAEYFHEDFFLTKSVVYVPA